MQMHGDKRTARDLRTYLRRRRDGGPAASEYLRYIEVVPEAPAQGLPGLRAGIPSHRDTEGDVRRIRREGQPWCPWLGSRVSVAEDDDLQALFAAVDVEDDPRQWYRLAYRDARSDAGARRTLDRLRTEGRRLLKAAQERAAAEVQAGGGRPGLRPPPRRSGGPLQDVGVPVFG